MINKLKYKLKTKATIQGFIKCVLFFAVAVNFAYCSGKSNNMNETNEKNLKKQTEKNMVHGKSANTGKLTAPIDLSWSASKNTPVGGEAMVIVNITAPVDLDSMNVNSQFPPSVILVSGKAIINAGFTNAQTKLSDTFYVTSNSVGTKTLTILATVHVNGQTMSKVIGIDVFFSDSNVININGGSSQKLNNNKRNTRGGYSDLPATEVNKH